MGIIVIIILCLIASLIVGGIISLFWGDLDAFPFFFIVSLIATIFLGFKYTKLTHEELFWGFNWIGHLFDWFPGFWHWLTNPIGGE